MIRRLRIHKGNDKIVIIRTHADFDDYRISFRTDVYNYHSNDWVFNDYITRKYISEASMLQAFAAIVNECLFDGSEFDLNVDKF